uniref:Uncharacterized protein n=1 Tax=Leersia perrieri TaxID=77586 RepID=A0A0D9XNZ8_9ORYZ
MELEEEREHDQIQAGDLGIVGRGGDSNEGRGQFAYLVAYSKPYAVYSVGIAATSSPSQRTKRKRLRRIARLPTAAGGKTFTSVRSIHRAWIVGVGGDPGDTIIFDTRTEEVIHGPILNSTKWCPILMAVGDKPWGTYAFDTNSLDPYEWHKVDDKRLPFIDRATPH